METEAVKPLADLAGGDAETIGDFLLGATVVGPQEGGEAVGYPLAQGVSGTARKPFVGTLWVTNPT